MIDENGYRPNAGIILANEAGQVLWAKRAGKNVWQFPQGGIDAGESPEEALFRELQEELGLAAGHVRIAGVTRGWLYYKLPSGWRRRPAEPCFTGQKQKWFLLHMLADDHAINLAHSPEPEFDRWRWVSYWYPLGKVIFFKREVYRRAMKELAPCLSDRFRE